MPTTRRYWPRRSPWAWPNGTRPPMSRASTPPPRRPSWPAWPSATTCPTTPCCARGSPGSAPPTSTSPDAAGYVIKLLAVVERAGADGLSVRVHPALVPSSHPLAGVRDAFNAVFIEGEAAGELMLYGQGAGGLPTASAVVGDLIDASRNLLGWHDRPGPRPTAGPPGARRRPRGRVLREPRRGRPPRRTGCGHDRIRGPRRVHPLGRAGGRRRRRPAGVRDARWHVRVTCGRHWPTWSGLDAVERIGGVMRIVGTA